MLFGYYEMISWTFPLKNYPMHLFSSMVQFQCFRGDDDKEYLVKWKELSYDECYWEFESDISEFQADIERFNRFQSRSRKLVSNKYPSYQQKDFHQYERSPEFLSGGMLSCQTFYDNDVLYNYF